MNTTHLPIESTDLTTTTNWFRNAAPYIHAHRDATFVISIDGETLLTRNFDTLLHDIALLNSLGIRVVVVFGARPQIEQECQAHNVALNYHQGLRITDDASLKIAKAIIGELRLDIEAKLSFSLPHTPMADAHIRCSSGNFVTARPVGVRDGIDLGHTGEVRRIDIDSINQQLALDNIVLLPPIGFSPTGEIFNLSASEIATAVASKLKADKLIFISKTQSDLPRELTLMEAENLLPQNTDNTTRALSAAINACKGGVDRVHLLDSALDGALLQELFSRDGAGTLISAASFETTRQATIDDVGGILELIQPLEDKGVLVKRSRELLEVEIAHFTIMERDGSIVACAALYPYTESVVGELACLAVSHDYQKSGRGERLLASIEKQAKSLGLTSLCLLSTQAMHWFREQGYQPAEVADLPFEKQAMYNYQRNSKVFSKKLA
jgi:amino-acid N-acetyltransferase